MTTRRPDPKPRHERTDLAILATAPGELPIEAVDAPPEWIRIAPAGELKCRDGRTFTLEPTALVTRFDKDRVDIPIDLGHGTVTGSAAPALGWIDRLEARADGLWGHVREWLEGGRTILKARTHRYISPAFYYDDKGAAVWLHSVALVAAPALTMAALLHARPSTAHVPVIQELAATLGLDAGASRATCLAAVTELATSAVPLAVHEQTVATLAATRTELATLKAQHRSEKIERVVDGALKALKITPAERAEFEAMCATDAGLASVERLFGQMTPRFGPSGLDTRATVRGAGERSAGMLAAATTALLKDREVKGLPLLSYADAMLRVVSDPTNT